MPVHHVLDRLPEIAGQYREAVGSDRTDEEILLKGERIWNLEKRFNIAAGVEKDTLPPRLLREELPSGPAKGKVVELQTMLADYYAARGWTDEATRRPKNSRSSPSPGGGTHLDPRCKRTTSRASENGNRRPVDPASCRRRGDWAPRIRKEASCWSNFSPPTAK